MRQIIKYPGSKWSLAEWITGFMPEHHSYLEPFFGSGAVLFTKKPSPIETINDLDDDVVNLFACITADAEKLASLIALTPYARTVYDEAYKPSEDRFEKAAKFIARCDMSHGFRVNSEKAGFKMDIQGRNSAYAVKHWNQIPELLIECAARLKEVQVEHRPAIDVIRRFNHPNVCIYADPPYLLSTRHGKQYRCEMTEEDHIELIDALVKHTGPVILSGYDSELYNRLLAGWHKEEHACKNQLAQKTKEVLWMNFLPERQMSLMV